MACLHHKSPDQIPTFTIGADFFFVENYLKEEGINSQQMSFYLNNGLIYSPPYHFPVLNELGFDGSVFWPLPPVRLINQTLIDTFGAIQGAKIQDGIPMNWYVGPYLTTKEKIIEWWDQGWPKPFSKMMLNSVKKIRQKLYEHANGYCLFSGVPGPFECLSMGLGFGFMAKLMRKQPAFVHKILEKNWEVQKKALKRVAKLGVPALMCGDDYGFNAGLMIKKEHWRMFIKPILSRYVEFAHHSDLKFILHSCGAIGSIMEDLYEIGVDAIHSLNPTRNDLIHYLKEYGDQITLIGGIDDTHLLFEGTPEHIRRVVAKQVKTLSEYGSYIPGPTNFMGNQPIKNILAMMEALQPPR